jgi:hypothetical protein
MLQVEDTGKAWTTNAPISFHTDFLDKRWGIYTLHDVDDESYITQACHVSPLPLVHGCCSANHEHLDRQASINSYKYLASVYNSKERTR